MTKKQRRYLISAVVIVLILLLPVIICNVVVDCTTSDDTFDDVAAVPRCEYAMLLGTGPTRRFGKGPNQFYVNRITATVRLYRARKFKWLIISGECHPGYDETKMMLADLEKHGIPDSIIIRDRNGHRTNASVVNLKERYHIDSVIVISQKWHNERSIFIARHIGIHAVGYNADDVNNLLAQLTHIRELLARVKMFIVDIK
jgi:SanA protein